MMKVDVALSPAELAMCMNSQATLSSTYITNQVMRSVCDLFSNVYKLRFFLYMKYQ